MEVSISSVKAEVDIDLYADVMVEDEFFIGEGADLYDAVLATSGVTTMVGDDPSSVTVGGADDAPRPTTPNDPSKIGQGSSAAGRGSQESVHQQMMLSSKKHQVYIGNLTWWTSDKDIQTTLEELGVVDFLEVKFFENRANGQSKGFCAVTVGSEASLALIHDKLSSKEIHGRPPAVAHPSKQALHQFESQVKTRPPPQLAGPGNYQGNMNWNMNGQGGQMGPGPMMGPRMGYGGGGSGAPRGMMMMRPGGGPRGPPMMGGGPPPSRHFGHSHFDQQQGSPGNFNHMQRGPPMGMQPMPPHHPIPPGPPPPGMMMPLSPQPGPPGGPPPMHPSSMMAPRSHPTPPGEWNRPPPTNAYNPSAPHPGQQQQPLPAPPVGPPPMRGGTPPSQQMMRGPPGPAPHINPAFFNSSPAPPPSQARSHSGYPGPRGYSSSRYSSPSKKRETPPISEEEVEEMMCRNRAVSSSAITRAVTDAASGEYASAIETLVTAINLIKSSKVANGDRCKVLIGSLQDTLFGVEAKSYGGRRSRSKSRDGGHRRLRSRSRSRDFRRRSRDRFFDFRRERSRSLEPRDYRVSRRESVRSRYYEERERREMLRDRERSIVEAEIGRERETSDLSEIRRATRH